jgi:hypothetical protein
MKGYICDLNSKLNTTFFFGISRSQFILVEEGTIKQAVA